MLQAEPWLGYRVLGFVDDHAHRPATGARHPAARRHRRRRPDRAAVHRCERDRRGQRGRERQSPTGWPATCSTRASTSSCPRRCATSPRSASPCAPSAASPSSTSSPSPRAGWRAAAKRTLRHRRRHRRPGRRCPRPGGRRPCRSSSTRTGPVLFRQTRVGRNGKPFEVLKFRTMVVDAEARSPTCWQHNEADGPLFKMTRRPAVTRSAGSCARPRSTSCPSSGTCCGAR